MLGVFILSFIPFFCVHFCCCWSCLLATLSSFAVAASISCSHSHFASNGRNYLPMVEMASVTIFTLRLIASCAIVFILLYFREMYVRVIYMYIDTHIPRTSTYYTYYVSIAVCTYEEMETDGSSKGERHEHKIMRTASIRQVRPNKNAIKHNIRTKSKKKETKTKRNEFHVLIENHYCMCVDCDEKLPFFLFYTISAPYGDCN